MKIFYLLRHGQKEGKAGDPPLTQTGKKQAEVTAKYFKKRKIHGIYSSPFSRAVQTAEIIARELNLEVKIDWRLRERMNWGDKRNETFEQFMKEWVKTDCDRNYQPVHGDSSCKAGRRLQEFLEEVSNIFSQGNFLVVTHGGVVGDLLRNLFNEDNLPIVTDGVSHARFIEIPECSVTILEKEKDRFQLGQVGHLPIPL